MHMSINKELVKGSTKKLLLAVIAQQPMHGYQIAKEIETQSKEVFSLGSGSVYPALHALEKKGYLRSTWKEHDGRERKYYSLTRKGKTALRVHIQEWKTYTTGVNSVLKHVKGI